MTELKKKKKDRKYSLFGIVCSVHLHRLFMYIREPKRDRNDPNFCISYDVLCLIFVVVSVSGENSPGV